MAKYTLAEVCEKLLAVRGALAQGQRTGDACKAAGLSPGTYKKWLVTYAGLDLPSWVVAAPHRGAIALSGDGRHVFTAADAPEGFALARHDAATGRETARALLPRPRGAGVWREVLTAVADETGARLRLLVTGGEIFTWELARRSGHALRPRPSRGLRRARGPRELGGAPLGLREPLARPRAGRVLGDPG
jgi:hypothetical protein